MRASQFAPAESPATRRSPDRRHGVPTAQFGPNRPAAEFPSVHFLRAVFARGFRADGRRDLRRLDFSRAGRREANRCCRWALHNVQNTNRIACCHARFYIQRYNGAYRRVDEYPHDSRSAIMFRFFCSAAVCIAAARRRRPCRGTTAAAAAAAIAAAERRHRRAGLFGHDRGRSTRKRPRARGSWNLLPTARPRKPACSRAI